MQSAVDTLKIGFDKEKDSQLIDKAGVRKQLREYGALSFEGLLAKYPKEPEPPEKNFVGILKDLDSLKSIPAEPVYPKAVDAIGLDEIDLRALVNSLNKVTSPSSVSKIIKEKIDAHRDFFKTGIDIIDQEHLSSCPFCEQGVAAPNPKSVIDAYVEYFSDEEAKHKLELRGFYAALNNKERQLTETRNELAHQQSRYDTLRVYLPSLKEASLAT